MARKTMQELKKELGDALARARLAEAAVLRDKPEAQPWALAVQKGNIPHGMVLEIDWTIRHHEIRKTVRVLEDVLKLVP